MVGPPMNRSPEEPAVCLVRRGNMWTEIREDYILRIYRNLFRKRNKPGPIEELDRAQMKLHAILGLVVHWESSSPSFGTGDVAVRERLVVHFHGVEPRPAYRVTASHHRQGELGRPSISHVTTGASPLYRLTARTMSEELLDTLPDVASPITISLPPHKFKTTCYFEPCMVPTKYSSFVYIKLGSTRKRYVEEVNFKTRLVPKRFSESVLTMTTPSSRRYTSGVEIKCLPPDVTVFELEEDQRDLDEELDATQVSI
uniref:Uncharacterized protein n=1 Tax=Timema genevievae TaxID=629358 RepID=A0A7R9K6W2_TIMGE|nr:unnamed protein product [Timema genevievae]